MERAAIDFEELLLEQVQLFLNLAMRRRRKSGAIRPVISLEDAEMSELKKLLTDDLR